MVADCLSRGEEDWGCCYDGQTLLLFIYMGEVIYGMHRGWQQMAQSTLITMHFIKNQNNRSYRIAAHLILMENIIYLFIM